MNLKQMGEHIYSDWNHNPRLYCSELNSKLRTGSPLLYANVVVAIIGSVRVRSFSKDALCGLFFGGVGGGNYCQERLHPKSIYQLCVRKLCFHRTENNTREDVY